MNWPIALRVPINEHIDSDVSRCVYRYLDDNASVDAVSSKLREVCPSLYRSEDAACSKVTAHMSLFDSVLDGSSEDSDYVHHPIFRTESDILETGSVSALRWKDGEAPAQLGPLEGINLHTSEWGSYF
jgi:hypothetical protein